MATQVQNNLLGKSFKEQMEAVVATNSLPLTQAFIGVRNAKAFLMYCSTYLITRMNVLQVQQRAEIEYGRAAFEVWKDTGDKNQVVGELTRMKSRGARDLVANHAILPLEEASTTEASNCVSRRQVLADFIERNSLAQLTAIDRQWMHAAYDKTVRTSGIDRKIGELNSMDRGHSARIQIEMDQLREKSRVYSEEYDTHAESLLKMKKETFLIDWHRKLVMQIIHEATRDKKHLIYPTVVEMKKLLRVKILTECHKASLVKQFVRNWNGHVLRRAMLIVTDDEENGTGLRVVSEETEREMKEILQQVDLDADNFLEVTNKRLNDMRAKLDEESWTRTQKQIIQSIRPSTLLQAERVLLNEMLQLAVEQKKMDLAALLICNTADHVACRAEDVLPEAVAFTKIKELYKDMPRMDSLPGLTLDDILAVFPDDDDITKVAEVISKRMDKLDLGVTSEKVEWLMESAVRLEGETDDEMARRIKEELELRDVYDTTSEILKDCPFWMRLWYFIGFRKYHLHQVEEAKKEMEKYEELAADSASTGTSDAFFGKFLKMEAESGLIDFSLNQPAHEALREKSSQSMQKALSIKELVKDLLGKETPAELDRRMNEEHDNGTTRSEVGVSELAQITQEVGLDVPLQEHNTERTMENVLVRFEAVTSRCYDELLDEAEEVGVQRTLLKEGGANVYLLTLAKHTVVLQELVQMASRLQSPGPDIQIQMNELLRLVDEVEAIEVVKPEKEFNERVERLISKKEEDYNVAQILLKRTLRELSIVFNAE